MLVQQPTLPSYSGTPRAVTRSLRDCCSGLSCDPVSAGSSSHPPAPFLAARRSLCPSDILSDASSLVHIKLRPGRHRQRMHETVERINYGYTFFCTLHNLGIVLQNDFARLMVTEIEQSLNPMTCFYILLHFISWLGSETTNISIKFQVILQSNTHTKL